MSKKPNKLELKIQWLGLYLYNFESIALSQTRRIKDFHTPTKEHWSAAFAVQIF